MQVHVIENGKVVECFTVTREADGVSKVTVSDGLEVVERVMKRYRAVAVPRSAAFHRRRGRFHRLRIYS